MPLADAYLSFRVQRHVFQDSGPAEKSLGAEHCSATSQHCAGPLSHLTSARALAVSRISIPPFSVGPSAVAIRTFEMIRGKTPTACACIPAQRQGNCLPTGKHHAREQEATERRCQRHARSQAAGVRCASARACEACVSLCRAGGEWERPLSPGLLYGLCQLRKTSGSGYQLIEGTTCGESSL